MNIRRLIATISTVAIFSTLVVSTASATSAYSDVADGQWYSDGVNAVVEAGAGPTGDKYEPAKLMTRAEAARYAVLLAGYTVPAATTAPFSDVPVTHADAKYIAFAKDKSILGGYDNGKFGPNDNLTREQYAKMTVLAFELPLVNPTTASFSDVKSTMWSYKYVETAKSYGIITGYSDGTFRPAKNIQRDEGAVMVFRAKTAGSEGEGEGEGEVVVEGGNLGVAISDENPESMTLPALATSTAVFALDLTAGDKDVTFNGFTVHKKGVGAIASDFQAYLYEGNDRLTSGKSINSSTNNIEFTNVGLTVEAGETKTVTMKVDVGTTAASGSVFFELVDSDSVKSTADDVSGDFPVESEEIGLSTTTVGSITIAKNGSVTNPKVGEAGATVAKFKLTAATEAAEVSEIGLYVAGTIAGTDVTNLKLYVVGETEPLAEVDGVNSKDLAQFVFDTPYEIEKGGTKSFYVTADMEPGRNGDTLRLYIDEKTDVVAIGGTYGFGMSVTYTSYENSANDGTDASWSTLEGGDITFASTGPTAADIAVNAKDVHLMDFTVTAANDATFKNFEVGMIASVEAATAGGLIKDSDDSANFTDIKIINTESGETLMGPVDVTSFKTASGGATAIADATDAAQAYYLFTDEFSMEAGETLKLALTTDVANNTSLNNETLIASLQIGTTYPQVKDVNNKTLTNSTSLVPSSAITGKTMTVKSPNLTLSLASTPTTKTYVKGVKDIKFSGISFACGSASDCKVTNVTLQGYIDINSGASWAEGVDTRYLNAAVGSVALKDASGTVIAASKSVESDGDVIFDNLTWTIEAGETVTAYVVGDLSSNATAGDYYAFAVAATTDITAEDSDGNSIATITGTPNLGSTSSKTVYAIASDGGSLTVAVDAATAKEDLLVAGTADQTIGKYKFTTTDEAFIVKKLAVNNRQSGITDGALGDYDDNIASVKISYTNSAGVTETKTGTLTNGTAEFSGLDMYIAADDDAILTIYATLNTIGTGTTGADEGTFVDLVPAFQQFEAVAQGSGSTYKGDKIDATVAAGSDLDFGSLSTATDSGLDLDADTSGTDVIGASALGLSGSFDVVLSGDGAAPTNTLPVGTIICIDEDDGGTCSTEDLYMITAWTQDAGTGYDTITGILVDDAGGGGTYADDDDILYYLPGTHYLTGSNQMVVYESKPTLAVASSSPSGSRSPSATDAAFVFTVAADSKEKIVVNPSVDFTTCVAGTGTTLTNAAQTAIAVDGAACEITAVTNGDSVLYANTADLRQYPYASFWFRWHDDSANLATLLPTEVTVATADANDGTEDNTQALATSNVVGAPSYFVEDTWYFVKDVAMPTGTDATDVFIGLLVTDADTLVDADDIFIDRFSVYAEKIELDITSDADFDRTYDQSTTSAKTPVIAYLKDGSTTVATGYIDVLAIDADADGAEDATDGSAATVTFVPTSSQGAIEISKGTSKTYTVETSTLNLLADDTGSDDPVTFSMNMGTSSGGTVTNGDFWWNDTNVDADGNGTTTLAESTASAIKWLGNVSATTLTSNTVKY